MNYDSLIFDSECREYWQRRAENEGRMQMQAMMDERSAALRQALEQIENLAAEHPHADHTMAMFEIAHAALKADGELGY